MKLTEWPPQADALLAQLPAEETSLVEYKREWHDLDSRRGKAEFVKDVLALANTAQQDQPAYLVIGVDDPKQGREIVGVEDSPATEKIHQILVAYTNPVPKLDLVKIPIGDRHLALIRLTWNDSQLSYPIRDYSGILDTRLVYARRGPSVGFLRPAEVEGLVRSRGMSADLESSHPIHAGFVEDGQSEGRLVLRVANITEETVSGISIIWDIQGAGGDYFHRSRTRHNIKLTPGEALEDDYDPPVGATGSQVDAPSHEGHWLDVTSHIHYRDRRGFIRQMDRSISIDL